MRPTAIVRFALLGAGTLWVGQAALVIGGGRNPLVSTLPALLCVGLALVALLPDAVLERPLATVAIVLPGGALGLSLASITLSSLGVPLYPGTVLAELAAFVAGGVVVASRAPRTLARDHVPWWAIAGLLAALALTTAFCIGVNDHLPPDGNDWAKYLLYADQIREHHGLLIQNPFWLGGVPFRDDPGAPALFASLLLLSGAPATDLGWDMLVLTLLSVLATYAACSTLFGDRVAVLATLVYAVIPSNYDMNAWHGTANMMGLVALPLVLLGGGLLIRGHLDRRGAAWLAAALVATIAAHRLTGLIAVVTLALLAAASLLRGRVAVRQLVWLIGATAVIGAPVAWDLVRRARGDGGIQSYTAYLDQKFVWSLALRDLTRPAVVAALLAVVLVLVNLVRGRRGTPDHAQLIGLVLGVVALAYAYAWVVHFPAYYIRASYYMPLAIVFALAGCLAAWRTTPATAIALALVVVCGVLARPVVRDVGAFYRLVDRPALRGLDYVATNSRASDAVVTDRCYGFLSTWLVQRPIYAALEDYDIGPAAEIPRVREARRVMAGGAAGAAAARRIRARWALLSPNCPTKDAERPLPSYFVARYVSTRLAVFELRPGQLSR